MIDEAVKGLKRAELIPTRLQTVEVKDEAILVFYDNNTVNLV